MPQMAPLNWLTLMIVFATVLILFNITNYFLMSYNPEQKKISTKKSVPNWKW